MSDMSQVVPSVIPPSTDDKQQQAALEMAKFQVKAGIKSSANWFYWIAGLSLVNTGAAMAGSTWRFLIGLGITQVVDAIADRLGQTGHVAAFIVDLFIAGIFVLLGWLAGKNKRWAFVVGMVLFSLDALIFLIGPDIIGIVFHVYCLFWLFKGYQLVGKLRILEPEPRQGF